MCFCSISGFFFSVATQMPLDGNVLVFNIQHTLFLFRFWGSWVWAQVYQLFQSTFLNSARQYYTIPHVCSISASFCLPLCPHAFPSFFSSCGQPTHSHSTTYCYSPTHTNFPLVTDDTGGRGSMAPRSTAQSGICQPLHHCSTLPALTYINWWGRQSSRASLLRSKHPEVVCFRDSIGIILLCDSLSAFRESKEDTSIDMATYHITSL